MVNKIWDAVVAGTALTAATVMLTFSAADAQGGLAAAVTTTTANPPTVTLTVNGGSSATVYVGDVVNYAWSSTNADTFSSSYNSTCGSGEWTAKGSNGNDSKVVGSSLVNCNVTITYTGTEKATHQSAKATITVKILPKSKNPTPTPIVTPATITSVGGVSVPVYSVPTATFTVNGGSSATFHPGDTLTYAWASTNADKSVSSYTSGDPSRCGTDTSFNVNSLNGTKTTIVPSADLGCSFKVTYKVTQLATGKTAEASVTWKVVKATPSQPSPTASQPIVITNVSYSPAAPNINDFITTTVTVKNTSSVDYNLPFQVDVEGTTATVPSLAAGAQTTVTVPNAFSFSTPGQKRLNTVIIYPIVGSPGSGNSGNIYTNTLTFVSSSTQPQPIISVVSPQNGTVWQKGQNNNIAWNINNYPSTGYVALMLNNANGATVGVIKNIFFSPGQPITNQNFAWDTQTLTAAAFDSNGNALPVQDWQSGQYQIRVVLVDNSKSPAVTTYLDSAPITINSSLSTTSGCTTGAPYSSTTGAPCSTTSSTIPGCLPGYVYSSLTGASCGSSQTSTSGTPQFTFDAGSVAVYGINQSGSINSTSTVSARFNLGVTSSGGNVYLGTQNSNHPMFVFKVIDSNGNDVTSSLANVQSSFQVPTGTSFISSGSTFMLPANQSGTLSNVTLTFAGRNKVGQPLSNFYAVEISAINWSGDNTTWQTTNTDTSVWRTPSVMVQ